MAKYSQDIMIAAAHFYYNECFTQKEIADKLDVSRVMVTRLLKRARDEDMVQISVKKPLPVNYQLALNLEKKYGLNLARVVRTSISTDETMDAMGMDMDVEEYKLLSYLVHRFNNILNKLN